MGNDRTTVQNPTPSSGSRSEESMALRAAFARAGVDEAEFPQPASGDQVGRYTVLGALGEGGMGVVYKAYDPQLDRNVALKLLRRVIEEDESGTELRLQREAQMLAKLQHPNVVAVYDSGLTGYGVFIAMELLRGCTLREWLEQRPRSVAEILKVFRAAGEGLAAAHDAGFVHRDFKPSNVIVSDDDGLVRVLDFGVASLVDPRGGWSGRSTGSSRRMVSRPPGTLEPLSGSDPHLTDDGCVVGTPVYMAPEQVAGDRVNHRSDQFTFCVCLHLAIYGRSPVIGDGFEERRWNLARGRVLDERSMLTGRTHGRVPARVRRALRKGLSVDPNRRFSSMRALLDELKEPPRRWPLVAASATLALGFGVGLVFDFDEDPCAASATELATVWGEADRDAVQRAFVGSGHPQAQELWGRVEQQLDGYAAAWSTMHAESCHATQVSRQQSMELHDQRIHCLERRKNRMRSTVDALGRIESAAQAGDRTLLPFQLPRIKDCANPDTMSATLLPDDPELGERVLEIRRSIDEAETAKDSGELARGLELAHSVVERAEQTRYPPVHAEALECLGSLQVMGGSAREAQVTLEAAIVEAAKAGDHVTGARSWTWLIYALAMQRRLGEGKAIELAARAAVEQANDDTARGWLLNNLGVLYKEAGDLERSHELTLQALEFKQETLGEDHVDVGISWFNLGTSLIERKRYAEADEALEQARAIFEATVGPSHGMSQFAILGKCKIEHERGEYEAAIGHCGRVLERFADSPASHVVMGTAYLLMAKALRGVGRLEESRAHAQRGLELVRTDDPAQAEEIERWLQDNEAPIDAHDSDDRSPSNAAR
ncbi:protein kinase domain-containing protein [Paraliomyxa miuraensis]|uniref:serine/threonine-protein kinase n=1 Tax=Paraliomyxa miuraensis TaxID=376150 RepID=UPI00225782BC|nr:serine/threonine-protein kinase [Paraliomyxa miuraensis]MCX4245862.1 serine/threonine-protein kinase [Paraliomyxa miuraensis]